MRKCEKCGQVKFSDSLMSQFFNLEGRMVWVCFACLFRLGEKE